MLPLVRLQLHDQTISVCRHPRTGQLWLVSIDRHRIRSNPFHRAGSHIFPRLDNVAITGWDGQIIVGGEGPEKAAKARAFLISGREVPVALQDEVWCAAWPIRKQATITFWDSDGRLLERYQFGFPPAFTAPWYRRIIPVVRNIIRPMPRGSVTYTSRKSRKNRS